MYEALTAVPGTESALANVIIYPTTAISLSYLVLHP